MKNVLLLFYLFIFYISSAQCNDPLVTDFECGTPSHPITGALVTNDNPFPAGLNTSPNVGEYTDDGTQGFDNLSVDFGSPIDLSTNSILKLKLFTSSSIQILALLEGGIRREIFSDFSSTNSWQEFVFDFSSSAGDGNNRLVLFFNPGVENGTTSDTYYIDDIRFDDQINTPCEDPLLTDFECSEPSNPINGDLETIPNSLSGGINTSPNIGRYIDNGTEAFDNLIVDYGIPIDLSINNIFRLKFYSSSSVQILASLQGGMGQQEIFSDFSLTNTWQELTFDFSASQGNNHSRLVLFINPGVTDGTTSDIYFIDDLRFAASSKTTFTFFNNTNGWVPNDPTEPGNPSNNSDDIRIQSGTATLTSNVVAANITIDPSATLNLQSVEVFSSLNSNGLTNIAGLLIPNASQINANGNLTFISNINGTGIIGDATNTTINGDINVEHFIPASNRAFRLLSTSVQNAGSIMSTWQIDTHITGIGGSINGFDNTVTNQSSMFTVDEQSSPANFEAVTTTSSNLEHGTGYLLFIRGDRSIDLSNNSAVPTSTTLSSSGTIFQGDFVLDHQQLNNGDFEVGGNGSSLIANPYQAPVNMERVLNNSSGLNREFIHVYDPTLGDRGAFVTIGFGNASDGSEDITNLTNGTSTRANATATEVSRFLQPGNSIFVNTIDSGTDGTASPQLTFQETDKALNNPFAEPFEISNENTSNIVSLSSISIRLFDTESFNNINQPRDGLLIRFSDIYENSMESSDALKATNLDENIASMIDDHKLSIQSRKFPADQEIINLSLSNHVNNDYTFDINVGNLDDIEVFLLDRATNSRTLLENDNQTVYRFKIDPTNDLDTSEDRFSIAFSKNVLSISETIINDFSIFPNPIKNGKLNLVLSNNELGNASFSIFNMMGQIVLKNINSNSINNNQIDVSNLDNGLYILKLSQGSSNSSKKFILNN